MRKQIWFILMPLVFIIIALVSIDTYYFAINRGNNIAADSVGLPPKILDTIREKYHMNDPIVKQYWEYILSRARWDLGPSLQSRSLDTIDFIVPNILQGMIFPILILMIMIGLNVIPMRMIKLNILLFYTISLSIILCWVVYALIIRRTPITGICISICLLAITLSSRKLQRACNIIILMSCGAIAIYYSFSLSWVMGLNRWKNMIISAAMHRDYQLIGGISFFQNRVAVVGAAILGYSRIFIGRHALWRSDA